MCLSVSLCVYIFKLDVSLETSGPVAIKFNLKHHWGGGKAVLGFWPELIRILVSIATDSSHRVLMGKILCPL